MLKPVNLLMVGVGGQGIILASKVLAGAAQVAGYDIKISEIHGMAQRGGSVVTHVRLGEKVCSPIIGEGDAGLIIAFEQLEGLRYLSYLKPDGTIIINSQIILPVPVLAGAIDYPEDIIGFITKKISDTIVVDALNIALSCGSSKAVNMVLLGVLARQLLIKREDWEEALCNYIPERFLKVNQEAFNAGYEQGAVLRRFIATCPV